MEPLNRGRGKFSFSKKGIYAKSSRIKRGAWHHAIFNYANEYYIIETINSKSEFLKIMLAVIELVLNIR